MNSDAGRCYTAFMERLRCNPGLLPAWIRQSPLGVLIVLPHGVIDSGQVTASIQLLQQLGVWRKPRRGP